MPNSYRKNYNKDASKRNIDQEIKHFYNNQKKYLKHLIIIVLFKGNKLPKYCYPMPREPSPKINIDINNNLAISYFSSLKKNSAIEDGALLIQVKPNNYILRHFSCRIFPPQNKKTDSKANKGSGYNSSLHYSCISRVLSVYLINGEGIKKFIKGKEIIF